MEILRNLPNLSRTKLISYQSWSQGNTVPSDPLGQSFFPPELIMQNQKAIGLTDAQRNVIMEELQSAQTEFVSLQWDLQKETENLAGMISKIEINETASIDQLQKVLSIENNIKKRQIALLIRIKNQLTEDQQDQLIKIKSSH